MIGAIVLAAGRSRRMGAQKLLLPYAGQTVIEHAIDQLLAAPIDQLVVVVSVDGSAISQALWGRNVEIVSNPDPDGEMLGSVRCGLRALKPTCQAALVAVGDQPAITTALIQKLIAANQPPGRGIIVPTAGGKRGHPMLLSACYFDEILNNFDGHGLRRLLQAHPNDVGEISIDDASVLADIDLPEDYASALQALQDRVAR